MNYEELVNNHAAELIEKLVIDVVTKDPVEIRFDLISPQSLISPQFLCLK